MSKDLLVLADEYAAATATFARALALKDEADSMSPIAREAGDKRAVLAEALAALDTAQQEPSDLRGIDACPVAEWVDLVKRGYVSRDECLIAVKDIPLWIAKNSEQAQPSQADAQDAARYRWLAGHCRSTSEHWGGRWSIVVDGPAPKSHDSEDDLDAAIDAAMTEAAHGIGTEK